MNTIVRCPVTGRSHRAAFEAQIPTEVLRQDPSRSPVHHEGGAGKAALPFPRRAVDRAQDSRRQSQNCRSAATSLEGALWPSSSGS